MSSKSNGSKTIFKIFCVTAGFILIDTFAGALMAQAVCAPGTTCPEGQSPTGTCEKPGEINCAATPDYGLGKAAEGTPLKNTDLSTRVSVFIREVVGFVGVIFLILMIYGGLTWMTAGGNEEKVGKAKKIIVSSTIGIVLVMLAYAITYYIISTVT